MGKRNKGTSVSRVFEEAQVREIGGVDEVMGGIPNLGGEITPIDPREGLKAEVGFSDPGDNNTLSFVLTEDHFDDNPELAIAGLNVGDVIEVDKFNAVMIDYEGDKLANTELLSKHATIDTFYKDLVQLLVRRNATGETLGIPLEYLEGFNATTGYFTGIKLGSMSPDMLKSRVSYCLVEMNDLVSMVIEKTGIRSTFMCLPITYDIVKIDGLSVAYFSAKGSLNFTNLLDLQTGRLRSGL